MQRAVVRLNAPQLRGAYSERKAVTLDNLALTAWLQRGKDGFEGVVDSLAVSIGKQRWETHVQLKQQVGEEANQKAGRSRPTGLT